ncbi:VanZ family protein [Salipaludibacillus sp. CUR1]|uniref:VanZ family protein n=1 Tax=Salipaludibacillus sp. CUR1 TaxID=2820003 RepID=UPI001E57F79F|nr:VanZ family protein [Salipaludibacillus sp. CUR1]MCE7792888.1 VanZ family protein [Salipaludibacillus sp. CUR1]
MIIIDSFYVGLLLLVIYILVDLVKNKKTNILKRILFYSFLFYLINVAQETVGGIMIPRDPDYTLDLNSLIQFIPFYFVYDLTQIYTANGTDWFFFNASKLYFYNVLLLFPLGVYLAILFKVNKFKKAMLLIFLTSLAIETVQLILGVTGLIWGRTFNVDDLILNTAGGALGYLVMGRLKRWYDLLTEKKRKESYKEVS